MGGPPGRHFNKQGIQQGTQMLSIIQTDMQFELQIDKKEKKREARLRLVRCQNMFSAFQLLPM